MVQLLSGRELAATIRKKLSSDITRLTRPPVLGVILVGTDAASHLYVKLKEKAAREVGIAVKRIDLSETASTEQVANVVRSLNQDALIDGILVQLPLPAGINEAEIINAIDPKKDADGFHPTNLARLQQGLTARIPGVCEGIMLLIQQAHKPIQGKTAALLVNSEEFAIPLAATLKQHKVLCHILRKPDEKILTQADIIVSALGKPGYITSKHVADNAILIDVGTTKVGSRVVGDFDADSLQNRNVYLTPVPGGVGPMTVAMLLYNVYRLAEHR